MKNLKYILAYMEIKWIYHEEPCALQFSENFKVLYILNEEYESSKGSLESYCVSRYGRLSDRTKLLDLENAYNFIRPASYSQALNDKK